MPSDDDRIAAGVRALIARFQATQAGAMIEHLRIVDDPHVRAQFTWLRRNRRELWDELRPVILDSWHRVYPQGEHRAHAKRVAEDIASQFRERQRARG